MTTLKGITILVVDDEIELRETLREDLEYVGATLLEAESGRVALEKVRKNKIDVVISDVRMPDGDGMTLLKNLRTEFPKFPLVFLCTGYSDTSNDEAKALGAIQVFSKPYKIESIISAVFKAMHDSRIKN